MSWDLSFSQVSQDFYAENMSGGSAFVFHNDVASAFCFSKITVFKLC